MSFTPYDRPVRAAFVGLGRIYDLNMRAYVDNPDVEVVALVDPSEERREQRQRDWPEARDVRVVGRARRERARGRRGRGVCCRSRCTSTASSSSSATAGTSICRSRCATTSPSAQRMLDAAARERPRAARDGELPLLRAAAEAEGDGRVGRARRGQRLPHEDGGQRPRRLGRSRRAATQWQFQQMQQRPRDPRVRRRLAQARHRALAVRTDQGGARVDRRHRGRARLRRSTRRPPSCGSTTTGSAACGTSRSRSTCTCAPTTTRTTSGGRSPAARATRA